MNELDVSLHTGRFRGYLNQPEGEFTKIKFDVVKSLKLPNTDPLFLTHFTLPNTGDKMQRLSLSEDLAKRIYDFSEETFVNGRGGFDCRTFLGYVMGWDADISPGIERSYSGYHVKPKDTQNNLPYIMAAEDEHIAHAVLGIDQPGKSLSVGGFECPLIVARNKDLYRVFGSRVMLEVTSFEDL
jgi:hypothetical protein